MRTAEQKGTQLIFCDTSTPKEGFNIYDEVKKLLLNMGVRSDHIAFVHDASTEAQRAKLFAKVRSGDVRILLGSTFKLGMGVNVQDELVAIHHLDVPWRPADMTQREGRILRQGNQNDKVYIYRYITEGSFDAYSWQLLETKQRFISELLEGSLAERSGSDVESTVLNYAEVKALAIGNPLVKQRVETANELARVLALHRKEIETHIRLEKDLLEMPGKINHQAELVQKCLNDVRWYRANRTAYDKEERKAQKQYLADAIAEHLAEMREEDTVVMTYQGFDIVLSVFLIVMMIVIPVLIVIPIVIKLTSKGPAVFTQERVSIDLTAIIPQRLRIFRECRRHGQCPPGPQGGGQPPDQIAGPVAAEDPFRRNLQPGSQG
jgi:superfamily II DNA/RNA helicase